MNILFSFLEACDFLLILPFRLVPSPEAGFLLGTAVLALLSAAAGRLCLAAVARMQRIRRADNDQELARRQELSFLALKSGDKEAYLAQNRLAKDAYGLHMALASCRGAGLIWPGVAALGWLSWRFGDVDLPLSGGLLGPVAYFLPAYIAWHWAFGRLARRRRPVPPPSLPAP